MSRTLGLTLLTLPLLLTGCGSSDDDTENGPEGEVGSEPGPGESEFAVDPNAALTELPDIAPEHGFRIEEGEFVVAPGAELEYCVRIPVPEGFRDRDIALLGWDWDLPPFTHHYFIAWSDKEEFAPPGNERIPCDGVNPIVTLNPGTGETTGTVEANAQAEGFTGGALGEGKLLFGAGVGVGRFLGSRDYGRPMPIGGHFVTNHHVLNTSDQPITMNARFNMYVRDLADLPHPTHELNCLTADVAMGPGESRAVTATCTAPFDLDIILLASHAHNHLTKFETRVFRNGQTEPDVIYESTDWDSPKLDWQEEPLSLMKGDGLTFTCYYENPYDVSVAFGLGFYNEMCATMNGYAYPVGREFEQPPPLGALITQNDPPLCLGVDENGNITGSSPSCDLVDTSDPNLPIEIPFF